MSWVFRYSPYSGDRLVIHLAIADVVNDLYDNEFWIKIGDLATKTRCSVRTVQYAIRAMETDGLIAMLEAGGGRGKPARYRFLIERVQDLHPLETVQTDAEKGANDDIAPLCTKENSRESALPTFEAIRLGRAKYPPSFEAAWRVYPKRGDNKRTAYRAWHARVMDATKVDGLSIETRMESLRVSAVNYSLECVEENRENRFIKDASTFWGPDEPWKVLYRKKQTSVDHAPDSPGQLKDGERNPYAPEGWYDGDEAKTQ